MKILNKFIIFIYYFCVIILTVILLSYIFGIVVGRIFFESNHKTKYYYLELITVWGILLIVSIYIKFNFNTYGKKNITVYMEKNDTNYIDYNDLSDQINELEKFDIIIIIGFLIVFFNSFHHSQTKKLSLLNEDIGFLFDLFI